MALNVAPGIARRFVADTWPQVPAEIWQEERRLARSLQRTDIDFHAYGSDIDEAALAAAKQNAKRAGVENYITFEKKDVRDFEPVTERATVIVNPPYGERLLDAQEASRLYRVLGKRFVPAKGRSYTVITSDEDFEKSFGRKADKRRNLYNGMIKCQAYMFFK